MPWPNSKIAMNKLLQFKYLPILVLLMVNLFAGLIIVRDYGQSWDEPGVYNYGEYALKAYRSLFHPQSLPDFNGGATHSSDLNYYGPSYFIIATLLSKVLLKLVSSWTTIIAWHVVNFITFQIGIMIFYLLAKRWMSNIASFGATLLFAAQPLFWGHAFINPKDIPFAIFFLASIYSGLKMMDSQSVPKSMLVLLAGIILGMTNSFRVAGIFAGLLVFLYGISKAPRNAIVTAIPYFLVAALASYLTWPYLWGAPFQHYLESVRYLSKFPFDQAVLFAGKLYPAEHLPWNYFPTLLLLQLTEPLLILAAVGVGISFWRFVKGQREPLSIFLLLFLLPTTAIIFSGSTLYDNGRQLFFLLPPLFIVAGVALDELFSRFNQTRVIILMMVLIILPSIIPMIQLHPYEYIYYNSFIGGTERASRNFETDYWGTSFKDAAQYLNAVAPYKSSVAIFGPLYVFQNYARPDLRLYNNNNLNTQKMHYTYAVVLSTQLNLDEHDCPNGQVIVTISQGGAILAAIKKLPARTPCN